MDNCIFCNAKKSSPYALEFRCGTNGIQHLGPINWRRSEFCYETQIKSLKALLEKVGESINNLLKIIEACSGAMFLSAIHGIQCSKEESERAERMKKEAAALLPKIQEALK